MKTGEKRRSAVPDASKALLNGLGLAARAGRVRVGYDGVRRAIRNGEARVVIIAGDAPAPVRRRLERILNGEGTSHKIVLDGDSLGAALGRPRVVAVAVTERSLGRRILELAGEVEG